MMMHCAFDSLLCGGTSFSLTGHTTPYAVVSDFWVVSCDSEDEDQVHSVVPAMTQLAQQAHRLQPAKNLFSSFALPLSDLISVVAGVAAVDGRMRLVLFFEPCGVTCRSRNWAPKSCVS
jgi:hypothetical protein